MQNRPFNPDRFVLLEIRPDDECVFSSPSDSLPAGGRISAPPDRCDSQLRANAAALPRRQPAGRDAQSSQCRWTLLTASSLIVVAVLLRGCEGGDTAGLSVCGGRLRPQLSPDGTTFSKVEVSKAALGTSSEPKFSQHDLALALGLALAPTGPCPTSGPRTCTATWDGGGGKDTADGGPAVERLCAAAAAL